VSALPCIPHFQKQSLQLGPVSKKLELTEMEDRSTRTRQKNQPELASILDNVPVNQRLAFKRKLEDDCSSKTSKKRSVAPDFPAMLFIDQKVNEEQV